MNPLDRFWDSSNSSNITDLVLDPLGSTGNHRKMETKLQHETTKFGPELGHAR